MADSGVSRSLAFSMLADTFSFTESVFLFDSELDVAVLVYSVVVVDYVVCWSYKESDGYDVPSPAAAASPAPL